MNVRGWNPQSKVLVTRDLSNKCFVVTYVLAQEAKQFLVQVTTTSYFMTFPFHIIKSTC